ncbi:hypothetical protein [Sphingomonas sp. Leaf25]|uniref:hypothetical protein n=1 Tax=Sphingomonas sp. Leaf25 TaxID=1735692 RepID=UPI0006FCD153|nr:hypothetical protein [Sphingomonas sp. Leaf25]KQN00011.1 hypothetical protein ASE78_17745 [Sphingomonas sp. Leaf25]
MTVGRRAALGGGLLLGGGALLGLPRPPSAPPPAGPEDAALVARSARIARGGQVAHLQTPVTGLNVQMTDGQSLADGQETWPALSTGNYDGNLMLGDAVWYANRDPADRKGQFVPFGAEALRPLRAVTLDAAHTAILDPARVAALPPGDAAFGEPPAIGLANGLKRLMNRRRRIAADPARRIVAVDTAYSGQDIARLLPGAPFGFFERSVDAVRRVHALRRAEACVVLLNLLMVGEFNYYDPDGRGVDTTHAHFVRALNAYIDAKQRHFAAITGQSRPFATFLHQAGGVYTRDRDATGRPGLAVGQAQVDVSLARRDTFLVGPVYPVTDKNGHLDSNGSRWFGNQVAKVAYRVLVEGRDWEPLHPLWIDREGRVIRIGFHVPAPPLRFAAPWIGSVAQPVAHHGFRISDDAGDVPIADVALAGQAIVRIDLARDVRGQAQVWFAHEGVGGNGGLCDSDDVVLPDRYVDRPGMYPAARIAALLDRSYPAANWCVAFWRPVGFRDPRGIG